MMEEWKQIPNMDYEVSNVGNVRTILSKGYRIKKSSKSSNGYLIVGIFKNGHRTNILIHRAVADLFIGLIPNGMIVNHKDGNKLNNAVTNLEIISISDNQKHAIRLGLSDMAILQKSTRYYGNEHWTHKHPEKVAKGDNNGSRKHPETIWKGSQCISSKLTESKVKKIRHDFIFGFSMEELAAQYGITRRNIHYIVTNKTWRHIL